MLLFALYLASIAATYLVLRTFVWYSDRSARLATPPVGARLDPIEVVYLRRGPRAALRAVVLAMHERGLIQFDDGLVRHTLMRESPPADKLEWAIYDATATPKTFGELARTVAGPLDTRLAPLRARAAEEELLTPRGLHVRARVFSACLLVFVVGCGFSFATTLAAKNPAAPPAFAVLGAFGVLAIWIGGRVPRLSDRGKRFVQRVAPGGPDAALPLAVRA
jgi:uncharacterized protein (TIGR04222 family)